METACLNLQRWNVNEHKWVNMRLIEVDWLKDQGRMHSWRSSDSSFEANHQSVNDPTNLQRKGLEGYLNTQSFISLLETPLGLSISK